MGGTRGQRRKTGEEQEARPERNHRSKTKDKTGTRGERRETGEEPEERDRRR